MIQMTRAEYEAKYGVKPVLATSTLDTTPAPIRMTREEYNAIYGETEKTPGLVDKLSDRVGDFGRAFTTDGLNPLRRVLRAGGAVMGAGSDVAATAFTKLNDNATKAGLSDYLLSDRPNILDKTMDVAKPIWDDFEKRNPEGAQDVRDFANIVSWIPITKAGKATLEAQVKPALEESVTKKYVDDLAAIESKYVKTRNANLYSKDGGVGSRQRIIDSNVLKGSVDEDGLIRTRGKGGAIEQYRKQTIDGAEDIVRKNLKLNAETVPLDEVRAQLMRSVAKSGLEGADLVAAIRGVDREIKGLLLRSPDSTTLPLYRIHDAKISTTKNINYLTPAETRRYRTAVAKAYRTLTESHSMKFDVKATNEALAPYLEDIKRLERLDGARVQGGRLGKYLAQGVGSLVGMGIGSMGGSLTGAAGAAIGAEVGGAVKGKLMARSFSKATGKTLPKNPVLEQAKLRIPDKRVVASKGIKKTKEIADLEDDIAKNVEAQKVAIKKGDFTLVQALKEVYKTLVEALRKEVMRVKEMSKGQGERGFVSFFGEGQSSKSRNQSLMSNQNQPTKPPTSAPNKSISKTVPPTQKGSSAWTGTESSKPSKGTNTSTSKKPTGKEDVSGQSAGTSGGFGDLEAQAKGKSLEEFIKAQPKLYHGGAEIDEVKMGKSRYHKTFYMSDDPAYAKSYGGDNSVLNEITLDKSAKLADLTKAGDKTELLKQIEAKIKEKQANNVAYSDKNFDFYPYSTSDVLKGIADGKAHFAELPEIKSVLQELGYDGMITSEVEWAKNYGIWNKNMVKTKSQLTDIWKKANEK